MWTKEVGGARSTRATRPVRSGPAAATLQTGRDDMTFPVNETGTDKSLCASHNSGWGERGEGREWYRPIGYTLSLNKKKKSAFWSGVGCLGDLKKKKKKRTSMTENMRSASPSLASLFCQHKLALVGRSRKRRRRGMLLAKMRGGHAWLRANRLGNLFNKEGGGGRRGSAHHRLDLLSFPTSAGPTLSCVKASPWSLNFSLFERKRATSGQSPHRPSCYWQGSLTFAALAKLNVFDT